LKIPEGIKIEYIPPYSPELNPVERVFQEIRKYLKNKLFISLDELRKEITSIL